MTDCYDIPFIKIRGVFTPQKNDFVNQLSKETGYPSLTDPFIYAKAAQDTDKHYSFFTTLVEILSSYPTTQDFRGGITTRSPIDIVEVYSKGLLSKAERSIIKNLCDKLFDRRHFETDLTIFLSYTPLELSDCIKNSTTKIYPEDITYQQVESLCNLQNQLCNMVTSPKIQIPMKFGRFDLGNLAESIKNSFQPVAS